MTNFQSVLSGTLDENFLIGKHINIIGLATIYYVTIYTNVYIFFIDVLGQVMDCGDVENIQCTGGKQRKKLEFTLSNIK